MKHTDLSWLQWPFFDDSHRQMAQELDAWCQTHLQAVDDSDATLACQALVTQLGQAGWLRYCVPAGENQSLGGIHAELDSRSLCIARETLARHHTLADFVFAMQGLGSGAIALAGTPQQQAAYLPGVATGEKTAAFALSEPDAGSDVAALACRATEDGEHYVLDGVKTWISNGGIADFYCVFARTDATAGSRGISAFIVDANTPGLAVQSIDVMSPHPLATLSLTQCRVAKSQMLGAPNQGFKLAMRTLDIFRCSVAGAAVGMGKRALHTGMQHALQRKMFGQRLADFQLTQAALGDMATALDQGALLTYRAAWVRDVQKRSSTLETAMAKMAATESAQTVIDRALQMLGGQGLVQGHTLERLYRDIRALRIYEGATEVQKLIIARELITAATSPAP